MEAREGIYGKRWMSEKKRRVVERGREGREGERICRKGEAGMSKIIKNIKAIKWI